MQLDRLAGRKMRSAYPMLLTGITYEFQLVLCHDPLIHTKPQHEAGGTPLGIASKASGIAFKFLYIQFLVQKPFGLCTEILDFRTQLFSQIVVHKFLLVKIALMYHSSTNLAHRQIVLCYRGIRNSYTVSILPACICILQPL